mmetsp:Transcript_104662/g.302879  ORF Transcript_104662/g.302879 Transcript_104662/m.302879 type:complete len:242 (-) Transcript_104662:363-1088(-)
MAADTGLWQAVQCDVYAADRAVVADATAAVVVSRGVDFRRDILRDVGSILGEAVAMGRDATAVLARCTRIVACHLQFARLRSRPTYLLAGARPWSQYVRVLLIPCFGELVGPPHPGVCFYSSLLHHQATHGAILVLDAAISVHRPRSVGLGLPHLDVGKSCEWALRGDIGRLHNLRALGPVYQPRNILARWFAGSPRRPHFPEPLDRRDELRVRPLRTRSASDGPETQVRARAGEGRVYEE